MKRILLLTTVFMMMLGTSFSSAQTDADNFYKSDLVSVEKVSFSNQYKMKVAGNLFLPKNMKEGDKYPAIIVGHPMGAVKEQSANLYATKMAERGFVTLSIDLSFWGGSEGEPRNAVLPEVYAEDFSAAVDFLGTRPFVDRNLIGVITPDGATPMTTTHPTLSSNVKFMNFYPFEDIETISPRPMFFITGENAHSREFSEDAYRLAAEPKELYIVPGAGHVDLYDRVSLIPFDKLESFFKEYLKK